VTILIIPINFPEDTKSGCRKILYLPLHKKTQTTFSEIVKDFNILNSEGRQGYETFYWHVRLIAVKIKHHLFFNCAFNKRKVSSWTLKNESGDLDALQKKMFLDHVYFIQRRIDTFNKIKFAWPAKYSSDMRYFFTIRIPLVDVKSNLGIRKMSPEFCFD
jgi:hypothetical protein